MPENVSISVNGQSRVPPGFRFHPTEEELLQYYLAKKLTFEKIDLDVIVEVDLNKLEPWEIQERCKIGSTPQNEWYFFSHKDKKYPTGTRTNRATMSGFWKATGRDKIIYGNGKRIGMRKTLVFYKGRAPHGQKSDWIMHEYRLDDNATSNIGVGESGQEEGWVVCRIFKKKSTVHRSINSRGCKSQLVSSPGIKPTELTESANMLSPINSCSSVDKGSLDQILKHMGGIPAARSDEVDRPSTAPVNSILFNNINITGSGRDENNGKLMMKLPSLESPISTTQLCDGNYYFAVASGELLDHGYTNNPQVTAAAGGLSDWATIDQMLAAHLNGQGQHQPPLDLDVGGNLMAFSCDDRSSSFTSYSLSPGHYVQQAAQDFYSTTTGSGEVHDLWSLLNRSSFSSSSNSEPLM